MYQTSTETAETILSFSRTWRIRLEEVGGDIVIMGDEITKAESEHSATTLPDDIELGAVCAAGWTITTSKEGNYVGKKFKLYLYLIDLSAELPTLSDLFSYDISEFEGETVGELYDLGRTGELIPMGEFTCVKAPCCGDGRELHLYDKLYFADKPYAPGIALPAMASAVERDICAKLGVTCASNDSTDKLLSDSSDRMLFAGGMLLNTPGFDFEISYVPEGATMRQMLSYIAGASGRFGFIDRFGQYARKWYGDPVLTIDSDHADEPTLSESVNRIVGIRCTVGGEQLITGTLTGGRVIDMENPFMTQVLLNSLFRRVRSYSWYTAEIYHRLGDPRLDIGDVVLAESSGSLYTVPLTEIAFTFDGGMSASLRAAGLTEEEIY